MCNERWIDAHSVTCAICGGLADERRTQSWSDMDDPRAGESTAVLETTQALLDAVGSGEAHQECFDYVKRNGVEVRSELEAHVHR